MGRANSAEDDGNAAVSDEKLSALVYEAVVKALRDTGRSGAENIRTPTEEVREEKEPQQKTEKKETAVTRLAEYDLPEDVINSALAFADRFGKKTAAKAAVDIRVYSDFSTSTSSSSKSTIRPRFRRA